jgi:uncharacterized protein (TIGR02145 family)
VVDFGIEFLKFVERRIKMKQTSKVLLAVLVIATLFTFYARKTEAQVTDYDGNVYKTVKIGTQEWMSENLNVSHYRNGDPIPEVQNSIEWSKVTTGAWCYYENNPENGIIYGKLYHYYAVNDPRCLAPEGWHVPTDAEWQTLVDFLGGYKIAGGKLKAKTLWESPNEGATNESGFTAFPGGERLNNGDDDNIGSSGTFWSSSEYDFVEAWSRNLALKNPEVFRVPYHKRIGLSVRCVRD